MLSSFLRKFVVPVLMIGMMLPAGLMVLPQKAQADLPVIDITNIIQTTTTAINSTISAVADKALAFAKYVLDGIGWKLSTMIIQAVTASIVNWINSGFQGSPAFVQDLQAEFMRAANLEFEKFLRSNDLGFMCYPQSVRLSLILGQRGNKFRRQAQCTITGVVSNLQGFMNGNWSQGGLPGFLALSRAENNPYTATLIAESELARRIAAKVGIEDKKLQAGRLFKSFEVCEDIDVVEDCPMAGAPCTGTRKQNVCRIGTPGDLIATQISKAISLGQDKLVVADSIDEILSALLSQLARQALTGSGGLYGLSNDSYNGGAPYTNQLASGSSSSGGSSGLLGAIDEVIETESDYRDQKGAVLNLYSSPNGVEGKVLNVISCYQGKISSRTNPLYGSDLQTARTRITAASSTLTNVILPKKIPLAAKVASSTEIISAFSLLKSEVLATTSAQAMADYASRYTTLLTSAHTRADTIEAEREFSNESLNLSDATFSRSADPLNGLSIRLEADLQACRAFPANETTGGGGNN